MTTQTNIARSFDKLTSLVVGASAAEINALCHTLEEKQKIGWYERYCITTAGRILRGEIEPECVMPDVDTVAPNTSRAWRFADWLDCVAETCYRTTH